MTVLYDYPKQAAFRRVLPKSKIYDHVKITTAVRKLFVSQIDKIIWQYKLAPETINLPAKPGVPEIQVFSISLKTEELKEDVLRAIDQAIAFPIFFELQFQGRVKFTATYKRPSDVDRSKWVVDSYFESPWLPIASERVPLPVALDMQTLYEKMLRPLMGLPPREGESLKAQAERLAQIQHTQKEANKLETRMNKEKQFNRKVELNTQLRELNNELDALSAR